MKEFLILDDTSIYELDEECLKQKQIDERASESEKKSDEEKENSV